MRAGDLDTCVDLMTRTVTLDEYGGEAETWTSVQTWAKREDVGGMESLRAGQVASTVESVFTIRDPGTPIDATMRISDVDGEFEIVKITRLPGRRTGFELLCRSLDRRGVGDF